jgi:hypothetical protein
MDKSEIDVILQKGVDFRVSICKPNIVQKLFFPKGRKFVLYPATMGTLLKISNELEHVQEFQFADDKDWIEQSIESAVKYKDNLVRAIAYAIVNKDKEPSNRLLKFLNSNLSAKEVMVLIPLVMSQLGVQDFLSGLVLASRASLKKAKTNSTPGDLSAAS